MAGPFIQWEIDMTKKLPETKCRIAVRRGDEEMPEITENDLVFVVKDAYAFVGEPTTRGCLSKDHEDYLDTRMLASTPGQWNWLKLAEHRGQHTSGRKVGIQCNVMLSTVQEKKAPKAKKDSTSKASEMI